MSSEVDIVIVGGGAAGIGAARRLASCGLNSTLLEASSRLGGRAWTVELNGLALDLGCGWFHSADRNAWARIAEDSGVPIDRSPAAWGIQYRDLKFTREEQVAARRALEEWASRLSTSPPASDRAADALVPGHEWNSYIRAIAAFISGARLEDLSAADYAAYDEASTESNWRVHAGHGTIVARGLPAGIAVRLSTPVESLELTQRGVTMRTPAGDIRARAAILTMSTAVLAGGTLQLPAELDHWRKAAANLPLGHTEKLFLAITGEAPFERETQLLGDPRDPATPSYYIRPFGWPVIECFYSGEGTRIVEDRGVAAAFECALEQLSGLFGAGVRSRLRPLTASSWRRMTHIGGAYSYALPGEASARRALAMPFEDRVFFAGEATSSTDYSTAHGAHDSGVRAAEQAIAALTPRAHRIGAGAS